MRPRRVSSSHSIARPTLVVLALFAAMPAITTDAASLAAQSPPSRAAGLRVVPDGGSRDTVFHVQMPPGWHITTGPGALLFDPQFEASGRFSVEAEIFLFPGQSQSGYGIFVGGSALDGARPSYLAFLARRDGRATLERVLEGKRTTIMDWTASEAIKPHPGGEEPVRNVLRLSAERDSLILEANGSRVGAVAKADLPVDGIFGLRAGPDVNLHASRLDHLRRLAPAPLPRKQTDR